MTKSRSKPGVSYNYDNDRKERTLDVWGRESSLGPSTNFNFVIRFEGD
jgi:hypothetical protein